MRLHLTNLRLLTAFIAGAVGAYVYLAGFGRSHPAPPTPKGYTFTREELIEIRIALHQLRYRKAWKSESLTTIDTLLSRLTHPEVKDA
jgi:hypothetical protein